MSADSVAGKQTRCVSSSGCLIVCLYPDFTEITGLFCWAGESTGMGTLGQQCLQKRALCGRWVTEAAWGFVLVTAASTGAVPHLRPLHHFSALGGPGVWHSTLWQPGQVSLLARPPVRANVWFVLHHPSLDQPVVKSSHLHSGCWQRWVLSRLLSGCGSSFNRFALWKDNQVDKSGQDFGSNQAH